VDGQNLMHNGYEIDTIAFCSDAFPQIYAHPGDSISDVTKCWGSVYTQEIFNQ
jgi:hypothetical protein